MQSNPIELLADYIGERTATAVAVAVAAQEAWAEWIDLPAYSRQGQPQVEAWLHAQATAATVQAVRAATAYGCTVQFDTCEGRVGVQVGQA